MNCSNPACGAQLPHGKYRCGECGRWNSPEDEANRDGFEAQRLVDAEDVDVTRVPVGPFGEPFGGGLVPGCTYLIGGAPGGGKSTLALQLAPWVIDSCHYAVKNVGAQDLLYVASEEDGPKIKRRMRRLFGDNEVRRNAMFHTVVLNARNKSELFCRGLGEWLGEYSSPISGVVVDSLSGLCADDLRLQVEVAKRLGKVAVKRNVPVLLLSHVNKDDELAGLRALQHEVDATLSLFPTDEAVGKKGERGEFPRVLKTHKNREGEAPAEMRLRMTERGLVPEERKS